MFVVTLLGEGGSFLFLALALGLDGFSVCLALGMYRLRLRRVMVIGLMIGFFHMLLPLIGLIIGQVMSTQWTTIATTTGSFLLVFIGLYMIFSSLQTTNPPMLSPKGIRLLTIIFFISIDSFPVGISLGLTGVKTVMFIFLFGIISAILGWTGLLIGKKTTTLFGVYSEMVGGIILLLFGLSQLFVFSY